MDLQIIWFFIWGLLWAVFFKAEGFDFGIGTLMPFMGKNNINIIVKNYPVTLLIKFFPAVMVYQFFWMLFVLKKGKFISYLQGLARGIIQMPKMLRKRGRLAQQKRISDREFGELIKQSEYLVIDSIMARREAAGKGNGLFRFYQKLFF